MQSEKLKEVAIGIFILGFSVVGFLFINPTDAPVVEGPGGLSWQTIPLIYSGLLMALAILFLAITIFRGPIPVDEITPEEAAVEAEEDAQEAAAPHPMMFGYPLAVVRRAAVIVALIIYTWAMRDIGFALATPVFLFVVLYIFGRKNFRENVLVSVIGAFAMWMMFAHFLKMPLEGAVWDPVSPFLNSLFRGIGI